MAYVYVLPGLHLLLVFGICLFEILFFYLRHGWLGTKRPGEFATFSPSRGNPIMVPANFRSRVGEILTIELDLQSSPSGGNPISGAMNLVGI